MVALFGIGQRRPFDGMVDRFSAAGYHRRYRGTAIDLQIKKTEANQAEVQSSTLIWLMVIRSPINQ